MKILFTGGGTAGHVNPNLAIIAALQKKLDIELLYIGTQNGIERQMITSRNIPYVAIRTGKLRRYFSWQNFVDPLNLLCGIVQSFVHIRRFKPDLVFSKGGFVGLPVVIAAFLNRVPVMAHESDLTPGLANRLSLPFINTLCVTFQETKNKLPTHYHVIVTGTPIRESLFQGDAKLGRTYCNFNHDKPCLLVMGGSQGAQTINACIRASLAALLENWNVIHLCGRGQLDTKMQSIKGYFQLEYAEDELPHLLACADIIISRAGANAIYEILACHKSHILIPLSAKASRGDQLHNAAHFEKLGLSVVILEEQLHTESLLNALKSAQIPERIERIKQLALESAVSNIVNLIVEPQETIRKVR